MLKYSQVIHVKNLEDQAPPKVALSSFEKSTLIKAKKFVEEIYATEQITHGGHGLDHAHRVTGMSSVLGTLEKQPPFLPILAALLHDVGRTISSDKRSQDFLHGQLSREIASEFITSLEISKENKILVENALEDHPFLNEKVRQSYVVKILMDADRLDNLGALGPVKAGSYKWYLPLYRGKPKTSKDDEIDSIYGHFAVRMPQWADMMWTESGKKIAAQRVKFLNEFSEEFVKEITFMQKSFDQLEI